ncbi:GroES-like protein [Aspergillus steynii IBT 23096]|uniref:GroES-like protein n=1 Tax=Aspergillus steynii IBT 23096 TaxID=1392250 RepID=A0A2I2GL60_9EURO|nr:GroES-like protein [Aspergillus steynii IBT 23096]PLB53615.1 GroES-like protein [Aspergillus steynii IBT 23096]
MASIPETMWAAHISQFDQPYTITRVPVPRIRPNELLVKIEAAGYCHSDAQVLHGEMQSALPMIPSHEPVGVVVAAGDAADGWTVGDRVGILNFKNACDQCAGCRATHRRWRRLDARFCERRETSGFHHDGAFAEYMAADAATTVALPDSVSFEQGAPLLCAGATVWGALMKARPFLQPGDTVGILGIGGLGQLGVQFARALGYRAVAIDNRDESLQLTRQAPASLQPDLLVNSSHDDARDHIFRHTDHEGLAAVINCVDSLAVNAWSLELLRVGGVAVLLGLPAQRWQFDSYLLVFRELVIRSCYVAGRDEVEEMMQTVHRHGIRSQLTVVGCQEISGVPERYQTKAFRGRLVVRMEGEWQ